MGSLTNYKSKAPVITGSTTINHAVRVKLLLNCSEYVILEYYAYKQEHNESVDDMSTYIHTGFDAPSVKSLLVRLMEKGYILYTAKGFEVTGKWMDAFGDIEKEFDTSFWKKDGKVSWTGTKKKAFEYYNKLRKNYSKDYLVSQRDDYLEFLEWQSRTGFNQQQMMCQVFLNPMNERFSEDYKSYIEKIKIRLGVIPSVEVITPLTREQVNLAYGKNNNQ